MAAARQGRKHACDRLRGIAETMTEQRHRTNKEIARASGSWQKGGLLEKRVGFCVNFTKCSDFFHHGGLFYLKLFCVWLLYAKSCCENELTFFSAILFLAL